MPVHFLTEDVSFKLTAKQKRKAWLKRILEDNGLKCGHISVVFVSDKKMLEMNRSYLNHDYFTDILTFGEDNGAGFISGDLIISIDTVKTNAVLWNTLFNNELDRVMAHGILHLAGYDDKDPVTKKKMTEQEDYYLALRDF